ncbi:hypothetical protein Golax_024107 [Gossypium laxum]|uniref:Retrotransposon gag domain-containing protein n=1 Tax=Gossypium laxum TaxID=34288 RepID=A0A7J8ZB96_9ROSI|nr:hypothetical protein [Gossypium laxum]
MSGQSLGVHGGREGITRRLAGTIQGVCVYVSQFKCGKGNNSHDEGFEHKNRGACLVLTNHGEWSVKMEHYFHVKGIMEDGIKVNIASMFLIDIALLWWQGKSTDKRNSEIRTWKEFQHELKGQFYPKFTEGEAQAKLRWLTQCGTMGEYVREFKELMLQILDVTEIEAFLAF